MVKGREYKFDANIELKAEVIWHPRPKGVTEDMVKTLAKRKPLRVVFRDDSYGSDSVKINVEQIFKLLSPGTEVKTI